ncbi:MAG: hypothetical protein KY468_15145 [Armatimonadetes bacterium]|nr:hypothetical protein [Armatimonadota bacterium]
MAIATKVPLKRERLQRERRFCPVTASITSCPVMIGGLSPSDSASPNPERRY